MKYKEKNLFNLQKIYRKTDLVLEKKTTDRVALIRKCECQNVEYLCTYECI